MKNKIIGIVVEWNPFHNGHIQHIQKIRERNPNCTIVAAMSGSIVQRGEISTIDKFTKTKAAIDNGVDLVIELPSKYITQSATDFSFGAIKLLNDFGVHEIISGSECNDLKVIKKMAEETEKINSNEIKKLMKQGISYPKAISLLVGYEIKPNDILNKCYYQAILKINNDIKFSTIKRDVEHDQNNQINNIASGSLIREYIINELSYEKYIPKYQINQLYLTDKFIDLIKLKLIQSNRKVNIGNQLRKIIQESPEINLKQLFIAATTKSYTRSKVRRFILEELINIDYNQVDIYRSLGFSSKGRDLLKLLDNNNNIVSTFDRRMKNENNISQIIDLKYQGFLKKDVQYQPYNKK